MGVIGDAGTLDGVLALFFCSGITIFPPVICLFFPVARFSVLVSLDFVVFWDRAFARNGASADFLPTTGDDGIVGVSVDILGSSRRRLLGGYLFHPFPSASLFVARDPEWDARTLFPLFFLDTLVFALVL